MVGYTRRNFLEMVLKSVLATGVGGSLFSGCAGPGKAKKSLAEVLSRNYYATLTKDWDPIYGPPLQWFSRYKGPLIGAAKAIPVPQPERLLLRTRTF